MADTFIEKQANGYDTEVGEGGARLSTGQKQLLSFARVMLATRAFSCSTRQPASIDTETEQLIQRAITHVLEGRTSFIVAHRLSTIRSADRILVIRGGRTVEAGTHDELMQLRGYYFDLYTHQFREEVVQGRARTRCRAGRRDCRHIEPALMEKEAISWSCQPTAICVGC